MSGRRRKFTASFRFGGSLSRDLRSVDRRRLRRPGAVLLPDDSVLKDLIVSNLDIFYMLGACGLGLSLYLIHIYVTEIKRTLQAFWAIGVFGSLATYSALAQPAGSSLVQYVVENPTAVWFVGPLFAALTGLVFKEGLCYGKLEAGILTFVIPSVLLGHLTGLMDDGVKVTPLSVWMALFLVFAGRKFTQPIKDDIGDWSSEMRKRFGGGSKLTGTPSLAWSCVVVVASLFTGASVVHNLFKTDSDINILRVNYFHNLISKQFVGRYIRLPKKTIKSICIVWAHG